MENKIITFDNYQMRLIEEADTDAYYKQAIEGSDKEAKYYTGTVGTYSLDQIKSYVKTIVTDTSRYDFIITKDDDIIGEVVLSEIADGNAHYRICIFNKENFSKGIGFKATHEVFNYAFETLELKSIELEVFPFNERGIALYTKMGFELLENIIDDEAEDPYREICIMRLEKKNFSR